ncbi:MAG: tetratricopeptide repeat protein [Bacteroidales bacterium]|jgi:tetratricopeptide (TPR) repeat protein|nr:tetratricopeptide repeat protein [Bacteroidales bacterium]
MKKAGISTIIIVIATFSTWAAHPRIIDSLMNAGNNAYQNGQWHNAINYYTQIDSAGYQSANLYYNLGNAFFKNGNKANALLWYERALRLSPGNEDIEHNIAFVNQQIIDKMDVLPQIFIVVWWNKLSSTFTSNGWAILSIICAFVAISALLLLLLASHAILRKTGGTLFLISFLVGIFTGIFAAREKTRYIRQPEAIITEKVVSAQSAPTHNGKELFVIHEGLKIAIINYSGSYLEIRLPNGEKGWILAEAAVVI